MHWSDGLEAYVTPIAKNEIVVAFLWDRRRFGKPAPGEAAWASLMARFPSLEARLRSASTTSEPAGVGPLEQSASRCYQQGVLLIGDAAGYVDAITGEGISLGLSIATALPELLKHSLRDSTGVVSTDALRSVERAFRPAFRQHQRLTRAVLWLSRRPWLAERVIGMLGREPALFQHFLSANMGTRTPYSVSPGQVRKLVLGVLRKPQPIGSG